MTTSRITQAAVAITALALAAASAGVGGNAANASSRQISTGTVLPAPRTRASTEKYAYAWPVKPFRRQHPVRGFFGDPRVANHGESRQFHFGVDISAPNGAPVYATLTGRAYIHPLHPTTILVVADSGVEFSYWHVVPVIRGGQRVVAYKTVVGHIEAPYGHVHFSERRHGRYLNPLRGGALGPYADNTSPSVRSLSIEDTMLVAEAYDETPLAVPRPWHDLPVMPALVRWRLLSKDRRPLLPWRNAVDFRQTIPSASEFDSIWADGTTQNHVREPGRYRLHLNRAGELSELRRSSYVIEIVALDTRNNTTRAYFPLDL